MIIVKVKGGLGNQLFQFATGRHQSLKHNQKLVLDLSHYKNQSLRKFELEALVGTRFNRKWFHLTPPRHFVLRESSFEYQDIAIPENCRGIILDGYWQSQKYFAASRREISDELGIGKVEHRSLGDLPLSISDKASVAIHVRRGDYASNPQTTAFHGLLPMEYYRKSVDVMRQNIHHPRFFIFSDDPDWVQKSFEWLANSHTVRAYSSDAPVHELSLMARAPNLIIANSSFSWWAAWLRLNQEGKVIAPRNWFADPSISTKDLFPEDWELI